MIDTIDQDFVDEQRLTGSKMICMIVHNIIPPRAAREAILDVLSGV